MELKGKKALVTGGAVRIGRAVCLELARRGCGVVVHYNNSRQAADELVSEIRAAGGQAYNVPADLYGGESCRSLVDAADKLVAGLDILVNNASVFHKDLLLDATEQRIRDELEINAMAPILLSKAFAQHLLAGSDTHGGIVNLLDRRVAGYEKGALPYNLSKKMLAEFTRLAALEFAPRITVNAVAPGPVLPPAGKGDDYVKDLAGNLPLAKRPTPEAVAKAVAWLLEADFTTGQTIFVDSGQALLH